MAIDDEQKQKDHNEAIAKFTKGLNSTNKSMIVNARNDKQRAIISKLLIQKYKDQADGIDKSTAAGKLQRIELANQIRNTRNISKALEKNNSTLGKFSGVVLKARKAVLDYAFATAKSTVKTAANFIDAGERVKKYSDISKEYTGLIGSGMTKLFKIVDFNVDIFKQMSQTGAGFNGNMMDIRDAAKEARMPLLDFVDMMQRNSTVMAGLFGSVQSGVPYMTRLNSQLRDVTKNELAQFGLNLEETGEFLTTYLELERSRGATQRRSTEEVAAGTASYAKNLVLLSKLTGKNIKELDEQTRATAQDGVFRQLISKKTPEAAKGFEMMLGRLKELGPVAGQLFKEVIVTGTAMTTETALLNQQFGGRLVTAFKAFDGSTEGMIALVNVLKRGGEGAEQFNESLALATMGGADYAANFDILAKARGIAISKEDILNQQRAKDAFTTMGVAGYDVMDAIKANAEGTATEVQKKMIADFGELVPDVMAKMAEMAKKVAEANPLARAYDAGKHAIRITSDFFEHPVDNMISGAKNAYAGVKEFATAGEDGLGFVDHVRNGLFESTADKIQRAKDNLDFGVGDGMATGTLGATGNLFKDFGSGTLATLHGEEAVVPKHSAMGSVLSMLNQLTAKPSMLATASPTTSDNSRETARMNALLAENIKGLSEVMTKSEKHLNTLVNVGLTQNQKTHELITITKNKTGLAYVG